MQDQRTTLANPVTRDVTGPESDDLEGMELRVGGRNRGRRWRIGCHDVIPNGLGLFLGPARFRVPIALS